MRFKYKLQLVNTRQASFDSGQSQCFLFSLTRSRTVSASARVVVEGAVGETRADAIRRLRDWIGTRLVNGNEDLGLEWTEVNGDRSVPEIPDVGELSEIEVSDAEIPLV